MTREELLGFIAVRYPFDTTNVDGDESDQMEDKFIGRTVVDADVQDISTLFDLLINQVRSADHKETHISELLRWLSAWFYLRFDDLATDISQRVKNPASWTAILYLVNLIVLPKCERWLYDVMAQSQLQDIPLTEE